MEWAPEVGQFQAADLTGLRGCFSSKRLGLMPSAKAPLVVVDEARQVARDVLLALEGRTPSTRLHEAFHRAA